MKITLSVATSLDGAIDDMSENRLVLSTKEDWAEVYRLRCEHDAILIGANTLRGDNPTLGLKGMCDDEGVLLREPMRVVIAGGGELSPELRLFHRGSSKVVLFSNIERPELLGVESDVEVVVADTIDVAMVVTELEKRGVHSLFVEGGAAVLELFMRSGMVDDLRVACNPTVVVGDSAAPHFDAMSYDIVQAAEASAKRWMLGVMELTSYSFKCSDGVTTHDCEMMKKAVEQADNSPQRDSCYRVGAIIETANGELFSGYTLEGSPTHHAEQVAIYKAQAAGADLCGATIYSSLEPCSQRSSEPESCSEIIMRLGFRRVLFAMYEPSHFVECHGAENMRRANIEVELMDEYSEFVLNTNRHILGVD